MKLYLTIFKVTLETGVVVYIENFRFLDETMLPVEENPKDWDKTISEGMCFESKNGRKMEIFNHKEAEIRGSVTGNSDGSINFELSVENYRLFRKNTR